MSRRKILTVVGARPQFIKAMPVSKAIAACEDLQEVMVHTGQHFDPGMSDVFFASSKSPRRPTISASTAAGTER